MAAAAMTVARSTRRVHISASIPKNLVTSKLTTQALGNTRPIPYRTSESAEHARGKSGYLPEPELDEPVPELDPPALDPPALEPLPDEPEEAPAEVLSTQSAGIADLLAYLLS